MKLEGSLDAFSLPDVFQLLMSTRKTGGLHVRRADAHGVVYFSSGALCGASSDVRRQVLARRLVSTCAVSDEALGAAVDRAVAEPGTGVVRALAELGAIDPDVLQRAAHEQIVDTLFDVLRWPDGNFSFTVDEDNPDDVGLLLEADAVVGQARVRLTHWDSIAPYLPEAGTVLALAPAVDADPVISGEEWALLARVDGVRSVAAVVELTGGGDYVVVSKLAELVERGLLVSQDGLDDQGAGSAAIAARSALLERLEGTQARPAAPAPVGAPPAAILDEVPMAVLVDATPMPAAVDEQAPVAVAAVVEPAAEEPAAEVATPEEPATVELLVVETASEPAPAPTAADIAVPAVAPAPQAIAVEPDTAVPADAEATSSVAGQESEVDPARPVVPARPEPFTPAREPDFPDEVRTPAVAAMHVVSTGTRLAAVGNALRKEEPMHAALTEPASLVERDPGVNKSLLLRLIAGVRGL